MKIGILTQPLRTNYGGLLQCWALQRVLREMGHEAWVVQRTYRFHALWRWGGRLAKNLVRLLLGRKWVAWTSRGEESVIQQHTRRFIEGQIVPCTSPIYSTRGLRADYARQHYDAYVVGSDQVWRPIYSPCQPDFFLGFLQACFPMDFSGTGGRSLLPESRVPVTGARFLAAESGIFPVWGFVWDSSLRDFWGTVSIRSAPSFSSFRYSLTMAFFRTLTGAPALLPVTAVPVSLAAITASL